MILDASVRMGELTKAIPKAPADRGNQYTGGKTTPLSDCQKTKAEAVRDLGFSAKQVERFEALASNKDLVEQEKAQAREEAFLHFFGFFRNPKRAFSNCAAGGWG